MKILQIIGRDSTRCVQNAHNGFEEKYLILFFTGGLNGDEVKMVHTASVGSIMNKTPEEARILIQDLAKESRVQQRKKSTEQI